MAYNTRRLNAGLGNIGQRRNMNPPLSNNFVQGGALTPHNAAGPQLGFQNNPPMSNQQQQPNQMRQPPKPVEQIVQPPPPQQFQNQVDNSFPNDCTDQSYTTFECDMGEQKSKPFWNIKNGKVSKKEKQRRRNMRLSKILQPKNAVMILNELNKNASYTITENPTMVNGPNSYQATVTIEETEHVGCGRSKNEAKNMAAESALRYIVKTRQFTKITGNPSGTTETEEKDADGDEKMEVVEDASLPWQHVASFALYKLLNAWGEDVNQAKLGNEDGQQNVCNKPAKKMPENATEMNPLMLLNQMLPNAIFTELDKSGTPPNITFTFKCTVGEESFIGTGPNKKAAKRTAAYMVCSKILGVNYPPEILSL